MKKSWYFLVTILMFISQPAIGGIADFDSTWKAKAIDQSQKNPVEGVTFYFNFEDKSNGIILEKTCISNSQGECEVIFRMKRGLFSGSDIETLVRFEKIGYSKKALSSWVGYNVTFWMTSEERLQAEAEEQLKKIREKDIQIANFNSERSELIKKLEEAQKNSGVLCKNKKQCDKIFSLAEIYVGKTSDMKIQLVTNHTI